MFRHFLEGERAGESDEGARTIKFRFDEMFKTPRLESCLCTTTQNALFVYVQDPDACAAATAERCFTCARKTCVRIWRFVFDHPKTKPSKRSVRPWRVITGARQLAIRNDYYWKKEEKMVIFHTTTMGVSKTHQHVGSGIRIPRHYRFCGSSVVLVNPSHIASWHKDEVELVNAARIRAFQSAKEKNRHARKTKGRQRKGTGFSSCAFFLIRCATRRPILVFAVLSRLFS